LIADILHKIAEEANEDDYFFSPRPSMAGPERCIRQTVYYGLEYPKDPLPGRTLHVFNDGTFHEELVLDWLRQSPFQVHSEQMYVDCPPPMKRGRIDAIITDLLGIDRLLEIKSSNHFSFQRFWNGELPVDYLTQMAIYIDAIQRKLNPEIKQCLLLMKNKNTSGYLELLCEYDDSNLTVISRTLHTGETEKINEVFENIVQVACDKFDDILNYIKNKTLPKRQYDIDTWNCEYCGWGETCWEGYDKEFQELKTDEMLPNEVADMVKYYRELGGQTKDIKNEYDELRLKIKNMMKDCGVREGIAGEYICRLKLTRDNKERLYISKRKEYQIHLMNLHE
jgi:hypothetical protein